MPNSPADLIIENAKQVVTIQGHSKKPATGQQMEDLGIIEDGAVVISNGKVVGVGQTNFVNEHFSSTDRIDASNKVVTPGFVDAHTHLIFAGSRETELEMKIKGAEYLEILKRGGGILRTVHDTRLASKTQLFEICKARALSLLAYGTTTIEAKSGYGLTLEDEVKSLEVIRELNRTTPLTLIPTFLGAHAIPPEFRGKSNEYVDRICEDWIPEIAQRKLAIYCDVFCEKGVFEIDDSRRILTSGKRNGLLPRIHADEFYSLGGAELAGEIGAASADHLLNMSSSGLESLKRAGVIATLLPAAPLTLMIDKYPDARRLIANRVPVALGSDLSPSCWIENYQMILALACYKLLMTPAEALTAATINAAHSLQLAHQVGSIEIGKDADLLILNVNDYRFLSYRLGGNQVDTVIKNGKAVAAEGRLLQ
ncbi:MAG TPA: imidazolonepropionase [Candidatus Acidoferrales bacterium]|nr:imidazolonepropionase [Candidatus Acidoferrales bacterium]